MIDVYVDDLVVMQGTVADTGKVMLNEGHLTATEFEPAEGQICRVIIDAQKRWRAELRLD